MSNIKFYILFSIYFVTGIIVTAFSIYTNNVGFSMVATFLFMVAIEMWYVNQMKKFLTQVEEILKQKFNVSKQCILQLREMKVEEATDEETICKK